MTETPTAAGVDEIAEQLAAAEGPGMADLYAVDEATRRIFRQRADVIRRFQAAELRRIADHFATQTVPGTVLPEPRTLHMVIGRLRARADELDPQET